MNSIRKFKKTRAAIAACSIVLMVQNISAIELIDPTTRAAMVQVVQEINDYKAGIGPRFPTTILSIEERLAQLESILDQIIDNALPTIQAISTLESETAENYRQGLILLMQEKQANHSLLEQHNAARDLIALEKLFVELNHAINYIEEILNLDR
jgi:Skp family chaperone for outer membrane proteins